jgi:excisionase family DNA binding protein
MSEKLLTVREVSHILKLTEKEVIELAESGEIPAYKVAGLYLRFKKDQIDLIREAFFAKRGIPANNSGSALERIKDFFYFNDFYILSFVLIGLMIFFIVKSY